MSHTEFYNMIVNTLTVDENDVAKIIYIDRATTGARGVKPPPRASMSKISFENISCDKKIKAQSSRRIAKKSSSDGIASHNEKIIQ